MRRIGRYRQRRHVRLEALERRDLLAFDVSLVDDRVTFVSDAAPDSLTLDVDEGGFLQHDLPLTSNLVSSLDLDSIQAGEQRRQLNSIELLDIGGDETSDNVIFSNTGFQLGGGDLRVRASEIVVDGQISTTNTGVISLTAGRNIRLSQTASLASGHGDISLIANMGDTPVEGEFHGVEMIGATISSSRGDISLHGRGGNASDSSNHDGVHIEGGSRIESLENGRISLEGDAGAGTTGNDGVQIFGAGTTISAVDGSLDITGRGSPDSTSWSNRGVTVREGAYVVSKGSGPQAATIRIHGMGGGGTRFNHGVHIRDLETNITTVDGAIEIIGNGNGGLEDQANNGVVLVHGGSITSTGVGPNAGTIRLRGTRGSGTSFNESVLLADAGTKITAVDGDIVLEGIGSTDVTEQYNTGVEVRTGAVVESTGIGANAATISITGTGGNGTLYNQGVLIDDLGTRVSSVDGDIRLSGTGNGAEGRNTGVRFHDGAAVISTGTGPNAARITVQGTGSNGDGDNRGVWLESDATTIRSIDGDVLLQGTGGDQVFSQGVLAGPVTIESTGTGPHAASIVIDGKGGNAGVFLFATKVLSSEGNVELFGTGGALGGQHSRGIAVAREALVRSRGSGDIRLFGTGGDGAGQNHGVAILSGSVIEATHTAPEAGSIFVKGTAGPVSSSQAVRVAGEGTAVLTGAGDITLVGEAEEIHTYALQIEFDAVVASAEAGRIDLTAAGADSAAILLDAITLGASTSTGVIAIEAARTKLSCEVILHGVDEVTFQSEASSLPLIAATLRGLTPVEDYGQLIVPGDSRSIQLSGAMLAVELSDDFAPRAGDEIVLVNVVEASSHIQPLDDLPEGAVVDVSGEDFVLSYQGGDGNDLSLTAVATALRQNQSLAEDVNADGEASPVDALVIINVLNRGLQAGEPEHSASMFYDTNGDGKLSAVDALLVINYLNQVVVDQGVLGEGSSPTNEREFGVLEAAESNVLAWPHPDSTHHVDADTERDLAAIERVFEELLEAPELLQDLWLL